MTLERDLWEAEDLDTSDLYEDYLLWTDEWEEEAPR